MMRRQEPQKKRRFTGWAIVLIAVFILAAGAWVAVPRINFTGIPSGVVIDSLDGVYVYNNGPVGWVYGRNVTEDGYNVGLKYQCVELVKRYYLEHYDHRMPDTYGHARDFFDNALPDGAFNDRRGLRQYVNGSAVAPRVGDILVFRPWLMNRYGHVAIVSAVEGGFVEIIQQNAGKKNASRRIIPLEVRSDGSHWLRDSKVSGWLSLDQEKQNN